jgi:hypothetical protein
MRKSRGAITATLLSRNLTYGPVWRADLASADHPRFPSRLLCWRLQPSGKLMFEVRPLEMFDPSQSVAPLKAEAEDMRPAPPHP